MSIRSLNLKIREGTPRHDGPSLCESCRSATIVRGRTINEEIVHCSELGRTNNRIRFIVRSCNAYANRAEPTLYDLRQIAWELRTDKSGQRIGFVSAAEYARLAKAGEVPELPYVQDPLGIED